MEMTSNNLTLSHGNEWLGASRERARKATAMQNDATDEMMIASVSLAESLVYQCRLRGTAALALNTQLSHLCNNPGIRSPLRPTH
jgi:hypothetical protein